MKIIKLESQNVKNIKAITVEPDGHMVVLGGKNGAGKSSVLDSVMYAFMGKSAACGEPVRKGEHKATIKVRSGEYLITRNFGADGSHSVTVKDATTGAAYPSPQALLDKLIGDISFDPLEFASMEAKEQAAQLQKVAGINLSELSAQRDGLYQERTLCGRELKMAIGAAATLGSHDKTIPEVETLSSEILQSLEDAKAANDAIKSFINQIESTKRRLAEAVAECDELRDRLAKAEKSVVSYGEIKAELESKLSVLKPGDEAEPMQRLKALEATNASVRQNNQRKAAAEKAAKLQSQYDRMTAGIDALDKKREDTLKAAIFPIPGLSIADSGVTFDGIPFGQINSAAQLRVSVSIGMALNPELRVIFVRNGSLLDEDNFKAISDLARDNDYQVWVETVGNNKDVSVMIVDGEVSPA